MRKLFLIIAVSVVFLCGCQISEAAAVSDYKGAILKAQEIAIIATDTSETVDIITKKDEIEAFVDALELDKWTLEELPESAKKIGSFGLSQEATIELGQKETDGILYDVCKITLYDSTYVVVEATGLTVTFKISEGTENYLNEFF